MKKLITILIVLFLLPLVQADGFTVSSVSSTSVFTSDTDTSQEQWIIEGQLDGGGQSIKGMLTPEEVKTKTGGKYYTKNKFSIEISSVDETVNYEVYNEGVPIYKYEVKKYDAPTNTIIFEYVSDPPEPCESGTDWDITLGKSFWDYPLRRYCITKKQVGVKGAFENPFIGFDAKIKLTNGKESVEKTICSGSTEGCDGSSVSFDDVGVLTWTGNLVTGESPPNQDNFVAIKKLSSNEWAIAKKSTFDNYNPQMHDADRELDNLVLDDVEEVSIGDQKVLNAITPANSAASTLLTEDVSFTSSAFEQDENSGKVSVTLDRRLLSPNLVFRIKADWLGVVIPTGKPQILNVESTKMTGGEKGKVTVSVKNIGLGKGVFAAKIEKCGPFIQTSSSISARTTIQPADIGNLAVYVDEGEVAEDIIKSCKIKVYDVNDPSSYDYADLTLELDDPKICVPNKYYSDGQNIKQCNAEGLSIDIIETCSYGVIADGKGTYACRPDQKTESVEICYSDAECEDYEYCNTELQLCVQKSGCQKVMINGDPSKNIDVVFVGDGYFDNEKLKEEALEIIDYEGDNGFNGLMSVEPFKSNRNKFNFWMIKAGNKIKSNTRGGPDRGQSLEIAAECTAAEFPVILSTKDFRSYAYTLDGDAYLSFGTYKGQGRGRLFMHEFGHSFGKLADEYVEEEKGDRSHPPNCAPDMQTALQWWSGFSGLDISEGCSYINANYRPTYNSIMRNHRRISDGFGPVNEKSLLEMINKWR